MFLKTEKKKNQTKVTEWKILIAWKWVMCDFLTLDFKLFIQQGPDATLQIFI